MADDNESADAATRKAQVKGAAARKSRQSALEKSAPGKEDGHVSQVLRTVYQRAVDEDIPSEMLDLLSKLD